MGKRVKDEDQTKESRIQNKTYSLSLKYAWVDNYVIPKSLSNS